MDAKITVSSQFLLPDSVLSLSLSHIVTKLYYSDG